MARTTTYKTPAAAAKAFGRAVGVKGNGGGWLYTADGTKLAQGWAAYADKLRKRGVIVGSPSEGYLLDPQADERVRRVLAERAGLAYDVVVALHESGQYSAQALTERGRVFWPAAAAAAAAGTVLYVGDRWSALHYAREASDAGLRVRFDDTGAAGPLPADSKV
jgi:uncharacterized NAD-dependent epimerase/dehydratase family protein